MSWVGLPRVLVLFQAYESSSRTQGHSAGATMARANSPGDVEYSPSPPSIKYIISKLCLIVKLLYYDSTTPSRSLPSRLLKTLVILPTQLIANTSTTFIPTTQLYETFILLFQELLATSL